MKKNECFTTIDGRQLWDGRYCCVVGIVIYYDKATRTHYILANKRGPGCPNEIGKWNMPCGFLDAGSGEENIAREVLEETGVCINPIMFKEHGHGDLATSRNVTFRYVALVPFKYDLALPSQLKGGEENEVSEIAWISEYDIDKYDWAFEHEHIIEDIIGNLKFSNYDC